MASAVRTLLAIALVSSCLGFSACRRSPAEAAASATTPTLRLNVV
jgi:hypothetical protein